MVVNPFLIEYTIVNGRAEAPPIGLGRALWVVWTQRAFPFSAYPFLMYEDKQRNKRKNHRITPPFGRIQQVQLPPSAGTKAITLAPIAIL